MAVSFASLVAASVNTQEAHDIASDITTIATELQAGGFRGHRTEVKADMNAMLTSLRNLQG